MVAVSNRILFAETLYLGIKFNDFILLHSNICFYICNRTYYCWTTYIFLFCLAKYLFPSRVVIVMIRAKELAPACLILHWLQLLWADSERKNLRIVWNLKIHNGQAAIVWTLKRRVIQAGEMLKRCKCLAFNTIYAFMLS